MDGRAGQSYQRCRVICGQDENHFSNGGDYGITAQLGVACDDGLFTIGDFSGVDVMVNVYLSKSGMALFKTALIDNFKKTDDVKKMDYSKKLLIQNLP